MTIRQGGELWQSEASLAWLCVGDALVFCLDASP